MFKIGDKVRYVQLPEDHGDYLEDGGPNGVGVIVEKSVAYDWLVDFGDADGVSWPMLTEELELVTE